MGRRPTIQTTVTASLTKSSLGACNQMLPVKFASKFVCLSIVFENLKKSKETKDNSKSGKSHLRCLLYIHLDGALHHHL